MEKILKKYTTIPPHLYVRRAADKQLRNIIEEMQRPGYVLVARQMGKTNLLFNAKRELENENRLFVYVDLSNSFERSQECFRYIIDMIIEPNFEIFKSVTGKIQHLRSSIPPLAPHVEYTNSLRELFKVYKNNLIIILDEIDALTSVDYSDQIFAQIRSTYFAGRSNFPEFNNLTYVLSGVVDPTELIKDKNKSPFNIGEKIYLDDFSFEEHQEFLHLSKLDLTEELANEIYTWTNGNPRMTFDICSEIENIKIKKGKVTNTDLEFVVKTLYLTNFDVAPIDHIRELVRKTGSIREAVLKIHKGSKEISDELKKKLYLFGIITSDFNAETIKIKNKIISESLTIDWINSVELETKSLYELGNDKIRNQEFEEGISILLQYLDSTNKISASNKALCFYDIGCAYNQIKKYQESNKYFLKQAVDVDLFPSLHYNQKYYIGLNYLSLGEISEGLKYLEEIVLNYPKDRIYVSSLVNIAANLDQTNDENYLKSHSYLDKALSKLDEYSENLNQEDVIQLKTLANYYKAIIYTQKKKFDEVEFCFTLAKNDAPAIYLPYLTYFEFIIKNDENLLENIVLVILENKLAFDQDYTPICFHEDHLFLYLDQLIEFKKDNLVDMLCDYAFDNLYHFESKSKLFTFFAEKSNSSLTTHFFYDKILGSNDSTIDNNLLERIYRSKTIVSHNLKNDILPNFSLYRKYFLKNNSNLQLDDIIVFMYAVFKYFDLKKNDTALEHLLEIEKRFVNLSEDLQAETVIVYSYISMAYKLIRDRDNTYIYAKKTIELIDNIKKRSKPITLLNEAGLDSIESQLKTEINNIDNLQRTILIEKKKRPNDIVTVEYFSDRRRVTGKFKKIESDFVSGKCRVVL